MRDLREVIEGLLWVRGSFSNGELARALGVTKQRASQLAHRLVETGELARVGGPRSRLCSGPSHPRPSRPAASEGAVGFWRALAREAPSMGWVEVARSAGSAPRLREQARQMLGPWAGRRFLVLDFRAVARVGEAFADEALRAWPGTCGAHVQAINMGPLVERSVWWATRGGGPAGPEAPGGGG